MKKSEIDKKTWLEIKQLEEPNADWNCRMWWNRKSKL
jgi:hypothetical protein